MTEPVLSRATLASETFVLDSGANFGEVGETLGMTNGSETSLDKDKNFGVNIAVDIVNKD